MPKSVSWICVASTAALISGGAWASTSGLNDNKTLRSSGGDVVHSQAHGTCVRTEWEAGYDVCAPQPAKVVAVPQPTTYVQTVLSTEEKTVYFDFDSAELSEQAKTRLDTVAHKLGTAQDVKDADIVGYADRIGTSSYNTTLSQHRAEAVKNYLAQRGYVNANVAEVRGLGERDSQTSCDKSLSRDAQINCLSDDRRVEVELKYLENQRVSARR